MMLAARQVEVKEKYHNAKVAGLTESQLTPDGAIAVCDEVKQAIEAFVSEMGLSSRLLKVPDDWNAVPIFVTSVKKEVVRLRSEVPGIAEQTSLQQRKAKISELQTAYNQTYSLFIQMEKLVTDLNETTGSDVKLQTELVELVNLLQQKKDELSATGKRTELVRAGIDYLEKADSTKLSGKCPLCRNSTANLLENLKSEWETELESLAGHIRAEITKLQTRHGELTNALENLTNIKRKQVEAKNSLQTNRDAVGVFLGKTLAKEDDPLVLLKVELRQIDERLGELAQILNDRQGKLSNVDQKLELAMLIVAVLAAENKVETIQKLELSQESQEIDAIRDKCAIFIEDVRQIEDAVTRVLAEEAKTKIDGASLKIQDFFRRIADHPGLQSIQVVVDSKKSTGQNDYKFFDEQQRDITPILSQGDYNALALAIFLGLGVAAGDAGKFGFLILDDPSQSLAPEHQRRLVKILDEVSACRNIIISSMDDGFRGLLADGLTRMKKIFEYRDWTPTTGPKVTCK
jgi:DNA repair exonuclease SbcCD ATPase subunit